MHSREINYILVCFPIVDKEKNILSNKKKHTIRYEKDGREKREACQRKEQEQKQTLIEIQKKKKGVPIPEMPASLSASATQSSSSGANFMRSANTKHRMKGL